MPTPFENLTADPGAFIELVAAGAYLDESGASHVEWVSRGGWEDQISGPAGKYIPPLLEVNLTVNRQIDPLNPKTLIDGDISELNLVNNSIYGDYVGRYDNWHVNSVDQREWIIYAVGILSNGTVINLSDVLDSPLYSLVGIGRPEPGSDICRIRVQSKTKALEVPIQRETYSYPCPTFAGLLTAANAINLGNTLNITGTTSRSYWFHVDNPAMVTAQYLSFKDSGTQGHSLAIGLVSGGTIAAGIELIVRGQTPAVTVSAANVLRRGWHRIDFVIDMSGLTRTVYLDGAIVAGPTAITGTPTASSVDHLLGYGLSGSMSRFLTWSVSKTSTQLANLGRVPITGNEANLGSWFPLDEGSDLTVNDRKSGSIATGTLGANVRWGNSTAWHYAGILGMTVPTPFGTVSRVPIVWIDPPRQIGQFGAGNSALVSEVQSNHTAVSEANYTIDLRNSTLQVTSGALSGTYTATVTENNLWNSALLFGSSSTALAAITSPTGASPGPGRSLAVQCRPDFTTTASIYYLCGWHSAGDLPGAFFIRVASGSPNRLQAMIINNAGVQFSVTYDRLIQGRNYSIAAVVNPSSSPVLDCPANTMQLYVNGDVVGSVALTGIFTTTQATFGVGCRSTGASSWIGRIDEPLIFNRVISQDEVKALHLVPAESTMSGLTNGWHLDDSKGATSAAPFAGATSLTLVSITWVAGRSAPTDLARSVLLMKGHSADDLDIASWLDCLNQVSADCGWLVVKETAREFLDIVLAGLGFILYELAGIFFIKRWKGLTGTADTTLNPESDFQAQPVEAIPADAPVYQWTVKFNKNNSKQDSSNVAGGLATTDPDRYQYGSAEFLEVPKSDYSVLDSFPGAVRMERITALLRQEDAEAEALRLLEIHRAGGDRKNIAAFLGAAPLIPLLEIGPLFTEAGMASSNWVITGQQVNDGLMILSVWRTPYDTIANWATEDDGDWRTEDGFLWLSD